MEQQTATTTTNTRGKQVKVHSSDGKVIRRKSLFTIDGFKFFADSYAQAMISYNRDVRGLATS